VIAWSQPLAKTFNRQAIKSVDWGANRRTFVDGFWDMAAKELAKKFTKKDG
jgi:hypothetical protein